MLLAAYNNKLYVYAGHPHLRPHRAPEPQVKKKPYDAGSESDLIIGLTVG